MTRKKQVYFPNNSPLPSTLSHDLPFFLAFLTNVFFKNLRRKQNEGKRLPQQNVFSRDLLVRTNAETETEPPKQEGPEKD